MSEPWFDPNLYAWIPGTLIGVLGGLWGALVGTLAPRGKARGLVLGSLAVLLLAGVACLAAGVAALISGQPYGVWYGLLLAGVLGVVVLGSLSPLALNAYRQAEARRLEARDLP
jgi:peptidoglycan/LPS O-acetylase OafA/YrhL